MCIMLLLYTCNPELTRSGRAFWNVVGGGGGGGGGGLRCEMNKDEETFSKTSKVSHKME